MRLDELVVEVRDGQFQRAGVILARDLNLTGTILFNNVGSWQLSLASDHPLAGVLQQPGAGIIVSKANGPAIMSGPVISPTYEATPQNAFGTITFQGVTDDIILSDRLAYPDPMNPDVTTQAATHDTITASVEDVVRYYVDRNVGPSAKGGRAHPCLRVKGSASRGPSITKSARFNVLGTLLNETCAGSQIGFRVIQRHGATLDFETYESVDRAGAVRLSIENNGLAGMKASTAAPTITRAIIGGSDETTGRAMAEAVNKESAEAENAWGRRIERFVNGGGGAVPANESAEEAAEREADIARQAEEALADGGFTSFSAELIPSEYATSEYGVDWGLGDRVTVEGADGRVLVGYVAGAAFTASAEEGFIFGVVMSETLTQSTPPEVKLEQRLSYVERENPSYAAVIDHSRSEAMAHAEEQIALTEQAILVDMAAGDAAAKAYADSRLAAEVAVIEANFGEVDTHIDEAMDDAMAGALANVKTLWGHANGSTLIDGAKIYTGSILAQSLALGDFTNCIPREDQWTGSYVNAYEDANGPVAIITGNGTGNSHVYVGNLIPVLPGDELRFRWTVYANYAGYSGNVAPYFQWMAANRTTVLGATGGASTPQGTNEYAEVTADLTAPAGAAFLRFAPYAQANARGAIRGSYIRRKNGGELIVDGAIDGKTITGAILRTTSTANRGITINSTGLVAYSNGTGGVPAGDATLSINATTGSITMKGDLTSGSSINGATITGGTFQTQPTGTNARAIRISGNKMLAYNASGTAIMSIDGDTGALSITGNINSGSTITGASIIGGSMQTATSGARVEIRPATALSGQHGIQFYNDDGGTAGELTSYHFGSARGIALRSPGGHFVAMSDLGLTCLTGLTVNSSLGTELGGGLNSVRASGIVSTPGTGAAVYINTDNNIMVRAVSALKYKRDVRPYELNGRSILDIVPILYRGKSEVEQWESGSEYYPNEPKDTLGFSAESFEAAGFEELLVRAADGELEGLSYERVVVPLVAEVAAKFADMEARIEDLERRLIEA